MIVDDHKGGSRVGAAKGAYNFGKLKRRGQDGVAGIFENVGVEDMKVLVN